MRVRWSLVLGASLAVVPLACLDVADVAEPKPDSDSGTGGNGVGGTTGWPDAGAGAAGACNACTSGNVAAPPPTGWSYVTFASGSVLQCPTGYESTDQSLGDGLIDPGCGACQCDNTSAGCTVHAKGWSNAGCAGTKIFDKYDANGGCIDTGAALSVDFQLETTPGTCTPSATPKSAQYQTSVTMCRSLADSNCPCLSPAPSPFSAKACLLADSAGDRACPSGFGDKHAFGDGITDTRSCSGCDCSPSGMQCSVGSGAYCQAGCSSGCVGGSGFVGCIESAQPFGLGYSGIPTGGGCTPTGTAVSTGLLTPKDTYVVCCAP